MAENLVIVESPAKAKTIKKYLGKSFEGAGFLWTRARPGAEEGAVDPEHNFAMRYRVIERNEKHVEAIAKQLRMADALYLATDPDREGEAISWHLYELLRRKASSRTRSCIAWCSTRSPRTPSRRPSSSRATWRWNW